MQRGRERKERRGAKSRWLDSVKRSDLYEGKCKGEMNFRAATDGGDESDEGVESKRKRREKSRRWIRRKTKKMMKKGGGRGKKY